MVGEVTHSPAHPLFPILVSTQFRGTGESGNTYASAAIQESCQSFAGTKVDDPDDVGLRQPMTDSSKDR